MDRGAPPDRCEDRGPQQQPAIDFVALAGALGVPAIQVSMPGDVEPALRAMLDHDGPYLLEVMLDRDVS